MNQKLHDHYTRTIVGDKLVLSLGRPIVSHPTSNAYDWQPRIQSSNQPSFLLKFLAAIGVVLGGAGLILTGSIVANRFFITNAEPHDIPVVEAKSQGAVRIIDHDYIPESTQATGLSPSQAVMPSPLPTIDTSGVAIPLPISPPVTTPQSSVLKKVEKDSTEKPQTSVVVVDDGPQPQPQQSNQANQGKPPESPTKTTLVSKTEIAQKPPSPVSSQPTSGKQNRAVEGGVKFATPIEEKVPGNSTTKLSTPETKKEDGSVKITIVDIAPGGKSVLVTNPATRLPTKLSVGDKLPNGKTIQGIDEKAGSITADGTTYKLD